MIQEITVVVGVTQKLVIELNEARYQIWLESKATSEGFEMIRKLSPTTEESNRAM